MRFSPVRSSLGAAAAAAFLLSLESTSAGPLIQAEVTKVINQVSLIDPQKGERPAAVQDIIRNDLGIETGKKSRSELLFQDATLTRLGAETFFSFKTGTRDLTLEKGSMLLQVPKGLGGATIHTAAVTAAITGTTIMMEYIPNQYIKVLVLEGSLRLSRNGVFGDSLVLRPGKMVIMRPDAKRIPDPVDVDLEHITKTSSLVNFPGAAPLPSTPLMQAAIDDQKAQLASRDLVPTNLVMGHGTNVAVVRCPGSQSKRPRELWPGLSRRPASPFPERATPVRACCGRPLIQSARWSATSQARAVRR
jgi:FecR protein